MLTGSRTYTSFSCNDLAKAKDFYGSALGLELARDASPEALFFKTGGDTKFVVYAKKDHAPAAYTVLNFEVKDIAQEVKDLAAKGVLVERLPSTDAQGVEDRGPIKMAWFKDPAGNWVGLFQGP